MKEFPFLSKEGKLYEAFPCITLKMNDGSHIDVDYFGSKSLTVIPTRYMQKSEDAIIPIVKYLSSFKTEKDVMAKFLAEITAEMKEYHKGVFKVSDTVFVNWDNVSSLEVKMNHYVYCYENPVFVGNSKHERSDEEAKFIGIISGVDLDDEMEISEEKKDDDIDLKFLDFPMF